MSIIPMKSPPNWNRRPISLPGEDFGNQSVLLAGVNDCVHIQRGLSMTWSEFASVHTISINATWWKAPGISAPPLEKGSKYSRAMRGTPWAMPSPPMWWMPPEEAENSSHAQLSGQLLDHKIILRNYEGYITTYEEPIQYHPHDPKTCSYCRNKRKSPTRVVLLPYWMVVKNMFIKPKGLMNCTIAVVDSTVCVPILPNGCPGGLGQRGRLIHITGCTNTRKKGVQMHYRRLGKTWLKVSEILTGFLGNFWQSDREDSASSPFALRI